MTAHRKIALSFALIVFVLTLVGFAASGRWPMLGLQPNGHFIVSSGQEIEPGTISFDGRPADFAMNPDSEYFAVMTNREVFIATPQGVQARTHRDLPEGSGAGFHGVIWTGDRRGANWTPEGMFV